MAKPHRKVPFEHNADGALPDGATDDLGDEVVAVFASRINTAVTGHRNQASLGRLTGVGHTAIAKAISGRTCCDLLTGAENEHGFGCRLMVRPGGGAVGSWWLAMRACRHLGSDCR